MNITSVTASFKRTQSLPGYCNVATGITMTAEIKAADDLALIQHSLQDQVEGAVNQWIDAKLEQAGQPALYSNEPRFDLIHWRSADLVFIVPHKTNTDHLPGYWKIYQACNEKCSGQRLDALRAIVDKLGIKGSEFGSLDELSEWITAYITSPAIWSIVETYAVHGHDYLSLGSMAIPSEVLTGLRADQSLMIEPLMATANTIGFCDDVSARAADLDLPIARTLDEAQRLIQEWQSAEQDAADSPF